jgi:hypothetical protein
MGKKGQERKSGERQGLAVTQTLFGNSSGWIRVVERREKHRTGASVLLEAELTVLIGEIQWKGKTKEVFSLNICMNLYGCAISWGKSPCLIKTAKKKVPKASS